MDAPHVRFFDSDFYLCGAAPPSHDHHHNSAELPHRYLPGPPAGDGTGDGEDVHAFFGISHTHRLYRRLRAPSFDYFRWYQGWRHNRHEGQRIARQVGPLVDHARSNIKSNDVHGVTIVCLVDIFDKIPRSRLNDESSRMVAHFRTTWYRKVEECSAVSLCGNQILWSQFESFRR